MSAIKRFITRVFGAYCPYCKEWVQVEGKRDSYTKITLYTCPECEAVWGG